MTGDKAVLVPSTGNAGFGKSGSDRGLSGLVDVLYFLAILAFTAIAILALALAAPLAIIATALAGAVSAFTAGNAKRGGWRIAGA